MADRISGISGIGYNGTRVQPVTRHSPEAKDAILKQVEEQEKERAEIREYLAKYPNPDHLSFEELIEQGMGAKKSNDEEGYVLDIGTGN